MTNSVLLHDPLILICFGVALLFSVVNRATKSSGSAIFTALCISVSSFGFIRALLSGATLQELLITAVVFFIVDLFSFCGTDNGDGA